MSSLTYSKRATARIAERATADETRLRDSQFVMRHDAFLAMSFGRNRIDQSTHWDVALNLRGILTTVRGATTTEALAAARVVLEHYDARRAER